MPAIWQPRSSEGDATKYRINLQSGSLVYGETEAAMLDAMTSGAAVFEPEEVDVLAAACTLAGKRLKAEIETDPTAAAEIARLVHNLGRSRLRHKRRLATAGDAAALAAEAIDMFLFLQGRHVPAENAVLRPIPRTVPIFPAQLRAAPDTILRSR